MPAPAESIAALLQAQYQQALAPVTDQLFRSAGVRSGAHVLDIGTGGGDTALRAVELAGPTGFVVASDVSRAAMEALSTRLATIRGADRVTLLQVAAEQLALEPESFDVALARNCVMYFRDLPRACRNVHSALRPDGRFVASVYGPLHREPFHAVPIAAVQRRREIGEPYPEYVQAFRVGVDEIEQALDSAGFRGIERHIVAVQRAFPSVETAIDALRHSRSLGNLLSLLAPGEIEDAWIDIGNGFRDYVCGSRLLLPGEQIVLAATK
jgi:ubiquinone/menaquinone biosynthesis C-methylase UbiE